MQAGKVHPDMPTPGMALPQVPGAAAVAAQMNQQSAGPQVVHLAHLNQLKKLYIKQRLDLLEMFSGFEVSNTYDVYIDKASREHNVKWLFAKEQSECLERICFPSCRGFDLYVGLPYGRERMESLRDYANGTSRYVQPTIRVHRDFTCCLQNFDVYDQDNLHVLNGKSQCTNMIACCPNKYDFTYGAGLPKAGEHFLTATGPASCFINCVRQCPCRDPLTFEVTGTDGEMRGKIKNKPNGCVKMCMTMTDDYTVKFGPKADAIDRGAVLALAVRGGVLGTVVT